MKTQKQVEAWLKIKIKNFLSRIGGKTSYSKIGLKRLITQLHEIVDQFDEYMEGLN